MNKKARISMGLVALATAVCLSVCAFTNQNGAQSKADQAKVESYVDYLPQVEQAAKKVGLELAAKQCPDVDISVKATTPIYNVSNEVVGYSVAFESNGVDYGFANFDFTTENLVTDFAISENADSIFEELSGDFVEAVDNVDAVDVNDKIYSTNGIDYAVSADADGKEVFYYAAETYTSEDFEDMLNHYEENYIEYYDNTEYEDNFYYGVPEEENDFVVQGKILDWFKKWLSKIFGGSDNYEEIVPTAYPDHPDVLKEESKVLGELAKPVMLPQYSKEKSLVSQKTIMTTTKRYACGLVALTGICGQEDIMVNNSVADTFNKLWDVTDTQSGIYDVISNYGIDGIECSGTSVMMMNYGMTYYGNAVGAKIQGSSQFSPTAKFFQNAVDAGKSSVLCYQIKDQGGHGVSILGYTTSKVGNQEFDFIVAADGWYDDAPRYVMYYPNLFESTTGIVYDIVK